MRPVNVVEGKCFKKLIKMHTLTSIYDAPTLKVMEVIQSCEKLNVTKDNVSSNGVIHDCDIY